MTTDFGAQGEIQITMYDYIKKKPIDSLPEDMIGSKYTAAQNIYSGLMRKYDKFISYK